MNKRTVTTVKEFEYSEDGFLLKETVTETTVEGDAPNPSPYQRPFIPQGPYQHGGSIHYWDPKAPGTFLWNDARPITSSGIFGAEDC